VKADAYGHGARDCSRVALEEGAAALCVATAAEGAALREAFPASRILVMGPLAPGDDELARGAALEVAVSSPELPEGLPLHLKVDTGMGRFGMTPDEARSCPREQVVGLMSHLATADEDEVFARRQIDTFIALAEEFEGVTAHLANSAATLRMPAARLDAVRCGVALYGTTRPRTDSSRCSRGRATSRRRRRSRRGRARAMAAASSPSGRRGSGSSRSATRTASGAV